MAETIETIGTIIGPNEERDAIHVSVFPAVAAHALWPGNPVGFTPSGRLGFSESPLGIVDPYLKRSVEPNERFWLFLFPRQTTSLRHVWSHPAFPEEIGAPTAIPTVIGGPTKDESERWLKSFSETADVPGYAGMMDAIELIRRERERQITKKGFDAAHDDAHGDETILEAAIEVAEDVLDFTEYESVHHNGYWPRELAIHVAEKYRDDPIKRLGEMRGAHLHKDDLGPAITIGRVLFEIDAIYGKATP